MICCVKLCNLKRHKSAVKSVHSMNPGQKFNQNATSGKINYVIAVTYSTLLEQLLISLSLGSPESGLFITILNIHSHVYISTKC